MLTKLITRAYYLLFFLTPFVFTRYNYELFEYNKMMFVYFLTVFIVGFSLIRMIHEKKFIFQKTPLDIPLIIFLASQILSTVFSIDPHTSIWGYYSRSNGGLLSIISYLLLYWALAGNLSLLKDEARKEQILHYLKAAIFGGLVISLWGILEHFGFSFSCLLLTHKFNDSCWVQDVQARVFASLGQPNWMAAYLGMLLFPALYFALATKQKLISGAYYLISILNYLAFTYTNSRSAAIGMLISIILFLGLAGARVIKDKAQKSEKLIPYISVFVVFILITLLFGSGLTSRFKLIAQDGPVNPQSSTAAASSGTSQLESGGTESLKIRLIVWQGAIEIFKHYPVFGSGVETFAYSYYQYRPLAHNMVSEWDFLYNKAHNEYLNYLATTGIVGLAAYLLIIITYLVWGVRYIVYSKKQKSLSTPYSLLHTAILASYLFYLIQDVAQFSVVVIALYFYLFPALAFLLVEPEKLEFYPLPKLVIPELIRSPFSSIGELASGKPKIATIAVSVLIVFFSFKLVEYWVADTHYATGSNLLENGQAGEGYNELSEAVLENPGEPLYRNELAFAAASAAVALQDHDATLSASLKDEAIQETQVALKISPKNVSLWRTAIQTYYTLSSIDPSYNQKTLDTIDHTISLAPTDPKLVNNKALILGQMQKDTEAIATLRQAVTLKPDYHDALLTLAEFYNAEGQKDNAIATVNDIFKYFPGDPGAKDELAKIQAAK